MTKYDYFKALETLSHRALNAVKYACSENPRSFQKNLLNIRAEANDTLISLEKSLFEDFLPPLERDSIVAYAHSLKHITDVAGEHLSLCAALPSKRKSEEESLCISLASHINDSTLILRTLKKTLGLPDISGFREIAQNALAAHCSDIVKINSGALPTSCLNHINSTGRLRTELSKCFDKLIEIMLNNI
jgi:hypothetical protein